ncbi:MAG: RNase adapter RapZ [Desulfobacteraceae bacterium]|nr:MAG: RNase adapter RapZ [Desulfobacteraceae bacterium]
MENLKVYIITGLSGSGKSTAIQAFEDAQFYCVDNMPMTLVPKFLDLPLDDKHEIKGFVFVMDMRSQAFLKHYASGLSVLQEKGITPVIIFLEASENTLITRFSQTRRQHPLSGQKSLLDSIRAEREMMQPVKRRSDMVIDTTRTNVHELKSEILDLIQGGVDEKSLMKINILSFGFKYGTPADADLVVDMRFLSNPFFVPELKTQDGESKEVREFVLATEEAKGFLEKYLNLLDYLIPLYKKEKKAYLTIGVGCTGGRHRSVVIAREIFEYLNKKDHTPGIIHRDIDRDIKPS